MKMSEFYKVSAEGFEAMLALPKAAQKVLLAVIGRMTDMPYVLISQSDVSLLAETSMSNVGLGYRQLRAANIIVATGDGHVYVNPEFIDFTDDDESFQRNVKEYRKVKEMVSE